jgi:hypothetical protein
MRLTWAVVVAMTLAGCAPKVMQVALVPTDVELATRRLEPGTGTIKGSALMRQRGGAVVTCAGNDVFLIPATDSGSRELRRIFGSEGYVRRGGDSTMGGGTLVAPPQPHRRGMCNAQGFFTFDRVKPGTWYVMTVVVWLAGDSYQGGTLLGTAHLVEGGEAEIVLSH